MTHNNIDDKTQADIQILGKIDDFFNQFNIATFLHRCGIRKRHGHSVRSLIMAIFTLPFLGKNFSRGIVTNNNVTFGKDAAYEVLKGSSSNWRRLLLTIGIKLYHFFNQLTDETRESVLIVDDSPYDRSRSKSVELLSRVWDHSNGRLIKGFRMLTLCWSDGVSCLPLDFSLLSSSDAKKRLCENRKSMDKRCCAWQRRQEAIIKAPVNLETMVQRILAEGVRARYLLMDSWFAMPATVTALSKHIDVIGMVKKTPKIHYGYNGHSMDLKAIYRKLKKRRGRAKILASAIVTLKGGLPAKLVFVRDRRKKDWLALISTDIDLSNEDIVRIYGKRWDIGVSSQGHINQSVKVRPRLKDSNLVAGEAPWRETKMVKPSDNILIMKDEQNSRPQRTVNVDVASLHVSPVAETVDNARKQQECTEMSPIQAFSPAGYQRWHGGKVYVETGEALGIRRRKSVEEANPITLNGKWTSRYQGGGLGRSTVDRCAAKRTGRKGPRLMSTPMLICEAGAT